MKTKHFDAATYEANVHALRELQENANTLVSFWNQLNTKQLDGTLYAKWLADKDFIYKQYAKETISKVGEIMFNSLPEKQQRPELADSERMHRFLKVAEQYSPSLNGMRVFVSTGTLDWKGGKAYISDNTLKQIKERCTYVETSKDTERIKAIQQYVEARNEATQLLGADIPVKRSTDGTISLDVDAYFRHYAAI